MDKIPRPGGVVPSSSGLWSQPIRAQWLALLPHSEKVVVLLPGFRFFIVVQGLCGLSQAFPASTSIGCVFVCNCKPAHTQTGSGFSVSEVHKAVKFCLYVYLLKATVRASGELAQGHMTSDFRPLDWKTLRKASQEEMDPSDRGGKMGYSNPLGISFLPYIPTESGAALMMELRVLTWIGAIGHHQHP